MGLVSFHVTLNCRFRCSTNAHASPLLSDSETYAGALLAVRDISRYFTFAQNGRKGACWLRRPNRTFSKCTSFDQHRIIHDDT